MLDSTSTAKILKLDQGYGNRNLECSKSLNRQLLGCGHLSLDVTRCRAIARYVHTYSLHNSGTLMETDRLYRLLFYLGSAWNFAISTTLFVLTGSLPSIIGIEPPRYPIFIHFNLTSIFFFGCIQWIIARDLHGHRSFVKLLVWAKLAMGAVLLYSMLLGLSPKPLIGFLAPGVALDVILGLIFWRFLIFSRPKVAI